MKFNQMLTAPSGTDKYFIHTSCGGLNECIKIGAKSCLPNCVGYAWGATYKGLGVRPRLSKGNAEIWYVTNDGYDRGQIPRIGAIACWSKGEIHNGRDGAGHVARVEAIESDGTITTSNSGYGGSRFYIKKIKPPYKMNGYNFQGFIYPNSEEYEDVTLYDKFNYKDSNIEVNLPLKNVNEIAKEVIQGLWGNGEERKAKLTEAGYNYGEVQTLVNKAFAMQNEKSKVEPAEPEAPTTSQLNYKVGDRVNFDYLYLDSYASRKFKSIKHSGTITKIYYGRKAPYLIDNIVGFLNEDLIIK